MKTDTSTTTTTTADELTPQMMLHHLHMSCTKMHHHLIAYSKATTYREQVTDDDVPDYAIYKFKTDRKMTRKMLGKSQQILTLIKQHRTTYYPGSSAFEQPAVSTTPDWEGGTPRIHNNAEMIHWNLIALHISQSYAETLPSDTPEAAEAQKLSEMVNALLEINRQHGEFCVKYGDIDGPTCYEAEHELHQINPAYTAMIVAREEREFGQA